MWQINSKESPPTSNNGMAGYLRQSSGMSPTSQTGSSEQVSKEDSEWLSRAQSAYQSSTSYVDTNYRKNWEDSIRAFNSQHPLDSKFSHPAYEKRSRVYRPKTRAIIRKNEAAGAAAFFSNMDVVSVTPGDQNNKAEVVSSDIMKQLLQYRLTKDIPWYQIVMGGLQDAQVTAACAHIYWEYKEEEPESVAEVEHYEAPMSGPGMNPAILDPSQQALSLASPAVAGESGGQGESEYPAQSQMPQGAMQAGQDGTLSTQPSVSVTSINVAPLPPKVLVDRPVVDLFPVENLRIDPGANWIDPINSSPFLIHLIPMYVLDIKEKMDSGEWRKYADEKISQASESRPDSTRLTRQKGRDDPYSSGDKDIGDYEIVWIQRHIHRRDGKDWEFYMLGDIALLTDPAPLKESVLHGKRPYVMGTTVIETHKIYPSTVPQLSKGLQEEINEIANQRLDNVKFVLNKKYIVKRGKEADVAGLLRNVPGGVVMMDDPVGDIRELTWQDVTASSFQEHQGLGMEMDELLGNFNPAQLMATGGAQNPARNMAMVAGASGTLVEYALRTYVETFVQPVLRQIVLLEQCYETDQSVMNIAGKKAGVLQKFGVDQVTDDMLRGEMTLTVNVGMGATDPMQKLNKFLMATNTYAALLKQPTPGMNMQEVGKEIYGTLGYQDGTRFFTNDNPQIVQLQQQIQQMTGVISQLQQKVAEKKEANQIALMKTDMTTKAAVQRQMLGDQSKERQTQFKEEQLNKRALATHWTALHQHHTPVPTPMTFQKGAA